MRKLKHFSLAERELHLKRMKEQVFDVCIIGGGITGAGAARDAASRGMSVCLIEQNDFASGTSSRSSKLIHGGIRYLENLEFGLVFEALYERHILFEIAPHLVHPLSFILPVYEGDRVGMFKMGLGMWLYDLLALMHTPKFHERLNPMSTLQRIPTLNDTNLAGSYSYSDAYMDDDRLVIETLRSADRFGGALAHYVKAGPGQFDEKNRLVSLEAQDNISGKKFPIRAKHYVSTVGPWTDRFGSDLFRTWKKILRPSKGIHLTFSRERLPLQEAVVMATGSDNRIVFAIPRHEMVIIGTTDTDYPQAPETVHSERGDVDYLIEVASKYFPKAKIKEEDILASYSGVRPLVHDDSSTESGTSREHMILHTPQNVTFVAGGKYTTYRRMARDVIESVLKNEFTLEDRIKYARNQTRDVINPLVTAEKLNEAIGQSHLWAAEFGLNKKDTLFLAERHGFEGYEMLIEGREAGHKNIWEMEALFAARYTMCRHLRDFMLRRSPLFLATRDHGASVLNQVAAVLQKERNWSATQLEEEKKLYFDHQKFEMGWR